jgi:hypothetical protein
MERRAARSRERQAGRVGPSTPILFLAGLMPPRIANEVVQLNTVQMELALLLVLLELGYSLPWVASPLLTSVRDRLLNVAWRYWPNPKPLHTARDRLAEASRLLFLRGSVMATLGERASFRFDFSGTAGARGYPDDAVALLQRTPLNWPVAAPEAAAARAPGTAPPALAPPAPTPPEDEVFAAPWSNGRMDFERW